jgi:hypothetical protein
MEKTCELGDPDDLWVALEVAEHPLRERVRNLRVDAGVLDVTVPEMVGDIFDSATGVEQVDGDRAVLEPYDYVDRGELGGQRVGGSWRFTQAAIERFFEEPPAWRAADFLSYGE